jgi:UDP-N-acetylmuramoyl-L-alanyl-D-glutamate--2,6-diaminopimelate ligase
MPASSVAELASVVGGRVLPPAGGDTRVEDVTHDSRQVGPGWMFVAVRGATSDGHGFLGNAVSRGASAVCVDTPASLAVPQLVVPDTREAMGGLAATVHGNPSRALAVIGVTGTNGKTTVTHYVESIARSAGVPAGLIGTIQTRFGNVAVDSARTTPEATDFQRLLASMRDAGCRLVATEVSSHALALGRVNATRFEVAAFTNLSQDHLDFHEDMEAYLAAKTSLFIDHEVSTAVVNVDDDPGRRVAAAVARSRPDAHLVSIGPDGDVRIDGLRPTTTGTRFRITGPWGTAELEAPVIGAFNVSNAVTAGVCALSAGLDFDEVLSGLERLDGVPGRFERVSGGDPVTVIVDYAHTPAGIVHAIATARGLGDGRVIALVGAGGDRDRDKRPMMGEAASAADLAVITSDNPRSEDPTTIIDAVVSGVVGTSRLMVEPDRRAAIRVAIAEAAPGDVVLVLGRGHEPFQEGSGGRVPFDDRAVAREELAAVRDSVGESARGGST